MSRLKIAIENEAVQTVERLYKDLERRIVASRPASAGGSGAELPSALPCADLWKMRALPHWIGTAGDVSGRCARRTRDNGNAW